MKNDTEILSREQLSELIGKRIKEVRMKKGISQAELGRICGKDKQHIELIENSKVSPNVYTLYVIAIGLKVNLSKLLEL